MAWLLLTLLQVLPVAPVEVYPLGLEAPDDPCAVAEAIARQPPCVDPESCGAFRDWRRLYGSPGFQLLDPQTSGVRAAKRQPSPGPWPWERRPGALSILCPARE